jgi:hypothetical protein
MMFPGPELISKIHSTVLEAEGLVLNLLIFCRFVRNEIKDILRHRRRRNNVK